MCIDIKSRQQCKKACVQVPTVGLWKKEQLSFLRLLLGALTAAQLSVHRV